MLLLLFYNKSIKPLQKWIDKITFINQFVVLFEKQKDKPDPDVLLEMASYYVVSVEAMNKRLMDVSVFCTSRKHYVVVFC